MSSLLLNQTKQITKWMFALEWRIINVNSLENRKSMARSVSEFWLEKNEKINFRKKKFKKKNFKKKNFENKSETNKKSGIQYTDIALRSFKTLKERNKQRIIIQITPEVIRVVSAKDRTLLFDQAVDKISFCAPSNTYPDAFRWVIPMSHSWLERSYTPQHDRQTQDHSILLTMVRSFF